MAFSKDDKSTIINIICCVFGIGSLCLPYQFALAGPIFAPIALILMSAISVYSAAVLCKCLLKAPSTVQTFGDLGEHILGKTGRYLVILTQFGTCLLVPIAFLILGGGTLLPAIFDSVWKQDAIVWIPLMAIALLPVVLIRTLKEAVWASLLGAAGSGLCVVIAIASSLAQVPFRYRSPEFHIENAFGIFGILAMANGVAVIIPTLYREHPQPQRLPLLLLISLTVMSIIYGLISLLGYIQFGCTCPKNLLYSMPDNGWKTIAYLLMQIHISIAFAVLLNPALFLFERNLLSIEVKNPLESKYSNSQSQHKTANSKSTTLEEVENAQEIDGYEGAYHHHHEETLVPYNRKQKLQSYILRTTVVAILVFFAICLQSSFDDVAGFIGASAVTLSCIVLPCVFYVLMFSKELGIVEKGFCWFVIAFGIAIGIYCSYTSFENIVINASKYRFFKPMSTTEMPLLNSTGIQVVLYPLCSPGQRY